MPKFPVFPLTTAERVIIYGVLDKYPQYLDYRYELERKVFGIPIHWSVSIAGVVKDLIGARP